jgi:hypothetical protein
MIRYMFKPALCVLLGGLVLGTHMGCPDPQTGKIDPYLTARTVILQANTALALADGIFNQWLLGQTDAEKAKRTQQIYEKTRTAVSNGLQLALNGVDIAQQAKEDPDVAKLMAEADKAWKSLSKFLTDLLAKGDPGVTVALAEGDKEGGTPASQPATTSGGVGVKRSAVKVKQSAAMALPKSLIPKAYQK